MKGGENNMAEEDEQNQTWHDMLVIKSRVRDAAREKGVEEVGDDAYQELVDEVEEDLQEALESYNIIGDDDKEEEDESEDKADEEEE